MEGFLEERQEHPTGHGTHCAWPVGHSEDLGEFFVRQIFRTKTFCGLT